MNFNRSRVTFQMLAILACGIIIMCVFSSPIVLTMDSDDNDSNNENYLVYGLQKSSSSSSFSSSKQTILLSQELNYNQSEQQKQQQIIQSNDNVVKLLADMVRDRLNDAVTTLEITSKEPSVEKVLYADNISKAYMGIPGNLDLAKRKVAQEILSKNKDFGSVYFTMPNGDVYIGEPYSDQKQLPRLNYADRDWYKGVTATNNTYTSSVFISASIHAPATATAVPVYANEENNNNSTTSAIRVSGYWVGIVDLSSVKESINKLYLDNNERIVIVDHNATAIVDSNDRSKNDQKLKSFARLEGVKNALNGSAGSNVEIINGTKTFAIYHPIKVGSVNWAAILMSNNTNKFHLQKK
jgi:Cache domain